MKTVKVKLIRRHKTIDATALKKKKTIDASCNFTTKEIKAQLWKEHQHKMQQIYYSSAYKEYTQ